MEDMLTSAEVLKRYNISPRTLSRWINDRGCPVLRTIPGGKCSFNVEDVDDWLRKEGEISDVGV